MKIIFKKGDTLSYLHQVTEKDTPTFEDKTVHPVYSTFALCRDVEYCTRLFVLKMIDPDEEGIGTFVHITHISPALIGNEVLITGTYEELTGNQLTCSFQAIVENRIIASGCTGQKIIRKEKLLSIFQNIQAQ